MARSGFSLAGGIGRYLGALCPNKKGKKKNFEGILHRLETKLTGWTANYLSMAGRVTLAESVIGYMSSYAMKHTKIPLTICKELEKAQQAFVWGDKPGERKSRMISKDTICLPKEHGGLGICKFYIMNEADLMKLIWGFINEPEKLWVQVIKGKYQNIINFTEGVVESREADSFLWRSLKPLWPCVMENTIISLGDGSNTLFWKDRWIGNGLCMNEWCPQGSSLSEELAMVNQFFSDQGEWDLSRLKELLPGNIVDKIQAIPVPSITDGRDQNI